MKKTIIQLLFLFVVVPVATGGLLVHLNQQGFFNIDKVEVVVEDPPQHHEAYLAPLKKDLSDRLSRYKGQSLWGIKLGQVKTTLDTQAWVEGFRIHRRWPSSLIVSIKPHQVQMLLLERNGQVRPVIKEGELLQKVSVQNAPDAIIAVGEKMLLQKDLRKKAIAALAELPEEGSFSRRSISEIAYEPRDGFWMTLIKDGTVVKMGEEQLALKAARVSKVVDYLDSKKFEARVIDANLSKKVLVRLRKDP